MTEAGSAFVLVLVLVVVLDKRKVREIVFRCSFEDENEEDEVCTLQPHVEGLNCVYLKKA